MGKHYKILASAVSLLILLCLLISGCDQASPSGSGTESRPETSRNNVFDAITGFSVYYPLENDGCPKTGIAILNGETFELDNYADIYHSEAAECELSVTVGSTLEVLLAADGATTEWRASDDLRLLNFARFVPELKDENIKDGASAEVQRFVFSALPTKTVLQFKHINLLEAEGKSFDDLEYDYLLTIAVYSVYDSQMG